MNATLLDTQVNSKDLKVLSKDIKDIEEKDTSNFFEEIVQSMLGEVKDDKTKNFLLENLLNSPEDIDLDDNMLLNFSKKDIKKIEDNKNEEGEVLVEDLLKLSFMIKNNIDIKDFSTDNKELKTALTDKKTVLDFKDAKNIKDLLDIAKKNDINIKDFEFFQEKSGLSSHDKQTSVKDIKSEEILKMIDKKSDNSSLKLVTNLKNNKSATENTLKNILSNIDIKDTNEQTTTVMTPLNHENNKVVEANFKKEVFISNKHTVKTDISNINKQNIEVVEVSKEIVTKGNTDKTQDVQTVSKVKTVQVNTKEFEKNLQTDEKHHDKKTFVKNSFEDTQKIQTLQQPKKQQEHTLNIEKTDTTITSAKKETNEKQDISSLEEKPHHDTKVEHTLTTHKVSSLKQKSDVKHTINTFAQDFKEQVESYKPPLMKVKMQLSPKGMGDVDVTMINRGNNLHITVNSNPNTIAIFSQNQTEFKNALVGMGFSELNMSFNENGKNKDNSQNQKNKNSSTQSFEEEKSEDSFEMTTPIYV